MLLSLTGGRRGWLGPLAVNGLHAGQAAVTAEVSSDVFTLIYILISLRPAWSPPPPLAACETTFPLQQ